MTQTISPLVASVIQKYNLDISIVETKFLEESNRIDAEYYKPEFLIPRREWLEFAPIGNFLTRCEYGLSLAMNEEWIWEKIFRMNDLVNGVAINDDLKFVDIDKIDFEKYRVKKNDILFNRVNSIDFVGRTGIFKSTKEDSVFASYLVRVNVDESRIKPDYLNLFLNSKFWKKEILRKARRAVNQANVNAEELKRINIPILPYPFQEKLETLSEESFKYLEVSKSLYSEAEQILLRELDLIDWQPSKKNIAEKMSAEVELFGRCDAEFFQPKYDAIIEKIKNYKWWYGTIENLISIAWKQMKIEADKEYQYCELADIDPSLWMVGNFTKIVWTDLPSRARMKIEKWDVVVSSVAGSCEKVALIQGEDTNLVASTGFFILKPKNFNPETNLILMKSFFMKMFLERSARGMILSATNQEDFKNIIIPNIPSVIQSLISEKINASHLACEASKKLLEKAKRAVEIFIEEDEEIAKLSLNQ